MKTRMRFFFPYLLICLCLALQFNGTAQVMHIKDNNVGIGTDDPDHKLHLKGDAYFDDWIRVDDNRGLLSDDHGTSIVASNENFWSAFSDNGLLFFNRAADYRGGLVHNTNSMGFLDSDNNYFIRHFLDNRTEFRVNDTEKMQINSSGAIDITITADATSAANSGALEIDNALRIDRNEIITNTGSTLFLNFSNNGDIDMDNGTLRVDASANRVLARTIYDTDDLNYFLNPSSVSRMNLVLPQIGVNGQVGSIISTWSNGYFDQLNTTVAYTISDERIKQNIRPIGGALDRIVQLKPMQYDLIDPDKRHFAAKQSSEAYAMDYSLDQEQEPEFKHQNTEAKPERTSVENVAQAPNEETTSGLQLNDQFGFMAQDVEKVFPEIVKHDETHDLYSVSYTSLIPVIVESIKEQQAIIEQQHELILELQRTIADMEVDK